MAAVLDLKVLPLGVFGAEVTGVDLAHATRREIDAIKNAWYRHWIEHGLASLEARLIAEARSGRYTLGDMVTLADVVIVPQIFNAQRMDCNLNSIPTILRIFDNCMQLPAFMEAHPSSQPDAE